MRAFRMLLVVSFVMAMAMPALAQEPNQHVPMYKANVDQLAMLYTQAISILSQNSSSFSKALAQQLFDGKENAGVKNYLELLELVNKWPPANTMTEKEKVQATEEMEKTMEDL